MISPCSPFSATGSSGARRPRPSGGATWRSRRAARRCSTSAGRKQTKRRKAPSSTSAGRQRRPWWPSCRKVWRRWTRQRRCSGCRRARSGGECGPRQSAGLGDGFTGHCGRVGMAQDLAGHQRPESRDYRGPRWPTRAKILQAGIDPARNSANPPVCSAPWAGVIFLLPIVRIKRNILA